MKIIANARFALKSWDEQPYGEGQDLPRLTRARVTKTFTGDIEGEGQVEYLLTYRGDGSAAFVGLERVVGRIGGTTGTFVLKRIGVFESGQAKESHSVIPGWAAGELRGLRGDGTSAVGHGSEHPFTLSYELGSQLRCAAAGPALAAGAPAGVLAEQPCLRSSFRHPECRRVGRRAVEARRQAAGRLLNE